MNSLPTTVDQAVADLGNQIMVLVEGAGDMRKARAQTAERQQLTIVEVDHRVSEYVREHTSDEEYQQLRAHHEFLS